MEAGRVQWKGTYLGDRDISGRGLLETKGSRAFMKVYASEFEGPNRRGRPLGRWKDSVEYLGRQSYGRKAWK